MSESSAKMLFALILTAAILLGASLLFPPAQNSKLSDYYCAAAPVWSDSCLPTIPAWSVVDFNRMQQIAALRFTWPHDPFGGVSIWKAYASASPGCANDGPNDWGEAVASGFWRAGDEVEANLVEPVTARCIKLVILPWK